MKRAQINRLWLVVRDIRPRYFILAALLCGLIGVIALRANNQHMANLRSQLYSADKNNQDVEGALRKLQAYVTSHMNTGLSTGNTAVYPPIQLEYTYQRLVQQQQTNQGSNANLYTQAQAYCQATNPTGFSGRYRVPCIEQYVGSHGATPLHVEPSLYEFDFVAPLWSPDLAGYSLLMAALLVLMACGLVLYRRHLERQL